MKASRLRTASAILVTLAATATAAPAQATLALVAPPADCLFLES